jgi:hypothetical protein
MNAAEACTLLEELLEQEGASAESSSISAQIKRERNAAGKDVAWWQNSPADDDPEGPRKRAYLAAYWLMSDQGKKFFMNGIPLGSDGQSWWPDRAIINCYLSHGYLAADGTRFQLTEKGQRLVEDVLSRRGAT